MSLSPSLELDPALLKQAVGILRDGGLVAYPTDTVYGLAALPTDERAVRRLFEAKKRELDKAVPLLIASPGDLASVAGEVPEVARKLIDAFWPGALTLVLRKAERFRSLAVGETVAVRVPDHPVPRELARLLGAPITGTSANVSGGAEALSANEVRVQLGDAVDLIIEGGRCPGGRPSTVVDCTSRVPRIVRAGAIGREELKSKTGLEFV